MLQFIKMQRVLLIILLTLLPLGASTNKLRNYVKELDKMSQTQVSFLVASYYAGEEINMGLTLAGIVWKESNFGKYIVNSADGKYGSFGLAQILLQTSMSRHNVKSSIEREALKLRLITDHAFNLKEAVTELRYWKNYYKGKTKFLTLRTVASYNSGWKGYTGKGKLYSDDVRLRRKALAIWLSKKSNVKKFKSLSKYLTEIRDKLITEKVITQ